MENFTAIVNPFLQSIEVTNGTDSETLEYSCTDEWVGFNINDQEYDLQIMYDEGLSINIYPVFKGVLDSTIDCCSCIKIKASEDFEVIYKADPLEQIKEQAQIILQKTLKEEYYGSFEEERDFEFLFEDLQFKGIMNSEEAPHAEELLNRTNTEQIQYVIDILNKF